MILSMRAVCEALYPIFHMLRERRLLTDWSPAAAYLAATHFFCSYFAST